MQERELGHKLRERMGTLLAEHRARIALNIETAQAEYSAEEVSWNSSFAAAHGAAAANLDREQRAAAEQQTVALRHADEALASQHEELTSRVASAQDALRREAQKIPGAFGSLSERVQAHVLNSPPSAAVVGSVLGSDETEDPTPLVLPLVGSRGLILRGDTDAAFEFVDALFARIIATVPVSSLHLNVFDPEISGLLGAYSDLRSTMGDRYPRSAYDADGLRTQLEQVLAAIQKNTDRVRSLGQRNVLSIWEGATPKIVLNVVVVMDSPGSIDGSVRKLLRRIIDSGPASGALVIVLQTGDRRPATTSSFDERTPEQIDDELLSPSAMTALTFAARDRIAQAHLPQGDIQFSPIGGMTHPAVQDLLAAALVAESTQSGPVVGPERIIPEAGQASAADGIEVALGERENGSALVFRLRTENPPLPNALIGGDVGTGKSNLLHAMIYAIAAKYPREEVELMLLDFKSGTEFQRYAPDTTAAREGANWLPNAAIIGLESDRAFGLAVLQHLAEELDRRAQTFKLAGANGYDAYRRAGHAMPRLVALIDEFQTLFEEDDEIASESVQALSGIMRKGRAFGVHLVLSTQTLSGIRQLSTQGDAIFAQVPVRIALRLGRAESQVMLSQGNTAASRLQHRGEVILNERSGEGEENNVNGVVTHAEIGFTTQLQARLWDEASSRPAPRLFRGTVYAPRPTAATAPRTLALGEAVDVYGSQVTHEFGQDPLRSLAIVGSDARTSRELMTSVLESGFRGGGYERVVVVAPQPVLDAAVALSTETGIAVDALSHEDAAQWLVSHAETARAAGTLVVVSDVQRIIALHDELEIEADDPFAEPADDSSFAAFGDDADGNTDFSTLFGSSGTESEQKTAAGVLAGLAQSSSSHSDLVVSCQLLSTVEGIFGFDRQGGNGIAAYALAQVPLDELRGFFGHGAEQPEKSPRFFYTRAGSGRGGTLAIPYGHED